MKYTIKDTDGVIEIADQTLGVRAFGRTSSYAVQYLLEAQERKLSSMLTAVRLARKNLPSDDLTIEEFQNRGFLI